MKPPRSAPWPPEYLRAWRRRETYRFTALTWGTRGDVQPFLALGAELQGRGHRLTIAARKPFQSLIEEHGLEFHEMEEDGTDELMHTLADSRGGAGGVKLFAAWQRRLIEAQLRQFWEASDGADVLVSNAAYTTPALHVAERRGIPIVQAFFDPGFVATRDHAIFDDRIQDRGPLLNVAATRSQNLAFGLLSLDIVSAWRRAHGMSPLRPFELHRPSLLSRMPVLAAWSSGLLERPGDWPDSFVQTGRWHMPVKELVSESLLHFMSAGPPPVYLGFGSWGVHDRTAVTEAVLEALRVTGNRGVLHRNSVDGRRSFPEHVHVGEDLPHEWLFPRVKAVVHHGGAGTTGAVASAGVPSVIVPAFFGQIRWGELVSRRGAGKMLARDRLDARTLAEALRRVDDPGMRERAGALAERARAEGGVTLAAEAIVGWLEEAAS